MNKNDFTSVKEYIAPDFEMMIFEIESVITASGGAWEEDDETFFIFWE